MEANRFNWTRTLNRQPFQPPMKFSSSTAQFEVHACPTRGIRDVITRATMKSLLCKLDDVGNKMYNLAYKDGDVHCILIHGWCCPFTKKPDGINKDNPSCPFTTCAVHLNQVQVKVGAREGRFDCHFQPCFQHLA